MASINMPAFAFRRSLSEDAGTRSGFALTEDDLLAALGPEHELTESLQSDKALRIRSEAYADAVGDVLFHLGAADQPGMPTLGMRFMGMLDRDWRSLFERDELLELEGVSNHYLYLRSRGDDGQEEILEEVRERVRQQPDGVLDALMSAISIHLAQSPFYTRETSGLIALADLFRSENLPVDKGGFFEQRFIDYLARNPEKLSTMHWRQFEGLAAEWFQRQGYDVQLGPGRNDEGVDLRLWRRDAPPGSPPAVIVQCKREKTLVERVVVKALYADVLHEKAESGLVVTSSDLSPGARKDCVARAYPITAANRDEVRRWVEAMRQPATGVPLV
jgi:restriction system protein